MPNSRSSPPGPPEVLNLVPGEIVRALDVPEAFRYALTAINLSEHYGPILALNSIESYCDAAKLQQRRIQRSKASTRRSSSRLPRNIPGQNLFRDVHFYIICWARIARLSWFIRRITRFRRIGLALRPFNSALKSRIDCRDHLEHFEERLPGGEDHSKLAVPNDLLNMSNDNLTYGGRSIDIGPDSLRLLKTIHDEFLTGVLFDSIDVLAKHDDNCLSRLLTTAEHEVNTARMTKKVTRMLVGKK